mmetsp:Transcript_2831/g.6611  ORF Transcript_2831/g.6611 Transcript_2831/m.6611 type:complete len:577 (-) Transcript_2831:296-2026(-)
MRTNCMGKRLDNCIPGPLLSLLSRSPLMPSLLVWGRGIAEGSVGGGAGVGAEALLGGEEGIAHHLLEDDLEAALLLRVLAPLLLPPRLCGVAVGVGAGAALGRPLGGGGHGADEGAEVVERPLQLHHPPLQPLHVVFEGGVLDGDGGVGEEGGAEGGGGGGDGARLKPHRRQLRLLSPPAPCRRVPGAVGVVGLVLGADGVDAVEGGPAVAHELLEHLPQQLLVPVHQPQRHLKVEGVRAGGEHLHQRVAAGEVLVGVLDGVGLHGLLGGDLEEPDGALARRHVQLARVHPLGRLLKVVCQDRRRHLRVGEPHVVGRDALVEEALLGEGQEPPHHLLDHLMAEAVAVAVPNQNVQRHEVLQLALELLLGELHGHDVGDEGGAHVLADHGDDLEHQLRRRQQLVDAQQDGAGDGARELFELPAAVLDRPRKLHAVQRDPLRPVHHDVGDGLVELLGRERLLDELDGQRGRQRLQRQLPHRPPHLPAQLLHVLVVHLRPRRDHHEDRRTLDQHLFEESPGGVVAPLHGVEDEEDGAFVGALVEEGAEQLRQLVSPSARVEGGALLLREVDGEDVVEDR